MKKIFLISNGENMAYVAADDMNAALYLLQDEKRGVPSMELTLSTETEPAEGEESEETQTEAQALEISVVDVLAIEKAATEEAVQVYAKQLSNGKIILFPVTEVSDIQASVASESQEINRVYLYTDSAYLVK